MRRLVTVVCALLVVSGGGAGRALAQDEPAEEDVADAVARALFEQGLRLFHEGRFAEARQLFAESIVRSPTGAYALSARQMLARCNQRLGIAPPGGGDTPMDPYGGEADAPVDPYGGAEPAPEGPVDPYGPSESDGPVDPYGGGGQGASPVTPDLPADDRRVVRSSLTLLGGVYGLYSGIGLVAGLGDDRAGGGQLMLVLGGAFAGGAAGYWIGETQHVSRAQVGAVASATMWGAGLGLLFAGAADAPEPQDCGSCEDDVPAGDYLLTSAIFSTVGLGAGVWLASREPSRDDVALVNSFGSYGLLGSLMFAVAGDPTESRSFSLAGAIGTTAGLATGLWLAHRYEVPAQRMAYVDVGVGAGALAPWLFYALSGAGETDSDATQATGLASAGLAAAGGWLAWYWTRDVVAPHAAVERPADVDELAGAPPALLRRDRRGAWSLAPVVPRPFVLAPAAADPAPRVGLGIDVVSGRF